MTTPRSQHIAVFDVGKTSSKVVLLGEGMREIDSRRMVNRPLPAPPFPHLDTTAAWAFLCESLRDFHREHRVDAIAITTHGATAALIDDAGLVLPVLDYEYDISGSISECYDTLRPDFTDTLSPNLPAGLNLGRQLFLQKSNFSAEFTRAKHILTYPQYWLWRLTGKARSEATSLGSHTDLWHPETGEFSTLVDHLGRDKFPPLSSATATFSLRDDLAHTLGLPKNIRVTCGIHDSNASLLPYLAHSDISVISSGTWTIIMRLGGDVSGIDATRDMLANVDVLGRAIPTARFMGGREFDVLCGGTPVEISHDDLQGVIDAGIMALPSFAHGTGPFPSATGEWHGDPETDQQRSAAATVYIALMSETCLSLTGMGARIIVEGPFAKNPFYASILSVLCDVPVHVSGDSTGTAVGAATLITGSSGTSLGPAVDQIKLDGLQEYAAKWARLSAAD